MAYGGYPFPYDIGNLLVGAVRILYADPDVVTAVPDNMSDVMSLESPYTAATNWSEIGATRDSFTYTRGFETEGLEIQQTTATLFEEITNVSRTIEVSAAEFTGGILKIIEGADSNAVTAVAASANVSAQKRLYIGSFSTLKRYRFAFVARRNVASGTVVESAEAVPASGSRGRFVMCILNQAQMSADDAEIEFDKGTLAATSVTFTAFPDDDVTLASDNYGAWFFEDAGTIPAA